MVNELATCMCEYHRIMVTTPGTTLRSVLSVDQW